MIELIVVVVIFLVAALLSKIIGVPEDTDSGDSDEIYISWVQCFASFILARHFFGKSE